MFTLKKINSLFLMAGFLTLASTPVLAAPAVTVPIAFSAGDTIIADDMNANFSAIADGINNIVLTPGPQGDPGVQGPVGMTGAPGANGIDGVQGPVGMIGAPGANGIDGAPGANGIDGAPGPVGKTGAQGPIGKTGATGANGIDGATGPDDAARADICVLFNTLNTQYSLGLKVPIYCNASSLYKIGGTGPAGGIVFYVTDGGLHGLEAAQADQATAAWGCDGILINGALATTIGSGAKNTAAITAAVCKGVPAAVQAASYAKGWFLPSRDELAQLILQQKSVGGFASTTYWSSTMMDANNASALSLTGVKLPPNLKTNFNGVRPVRAF